MMEKQFYNEFSREFVALPSFLAKWHRIGFTEDDMIRLERELSANPKVGAVLKGTKRRTQNALRIPSSRQKRFSTSYLC